MNAIDISTLKELTKKAYKAREEMVRLYDKIEDIAIDHDIKMDEQDLKGDETEEEIMKNLDNALVKTQEIADALLDLTTYMELVTGEI